MKALFIKLEKQLFDQINTSFDKSLIDLGFIKLDKKSWNSIQNISVDYAIMEKCNNIFAAKFIGHWSDLGSWSAIMNEGINGKIKAIWKICSLTVKILC